MARYYTLVRHVPQPEIDPVKWALWFERAKRKVGQTDIGPYCVSTVFLGINHQHVRGGPPLLFETMIFSDGESLNYQERCSTWEQALAMHERGVVHARTVWGVKRAQRPK